MVRGLSVGKRFEAALIQSRLVGNSPAAGATQPAIRIEGNKIEGVVVDGHVLNITFDEELFRSCDTMDKLRAAHSQGLSEEQAKMFACPDDAPPGELFVSGGIAYATIVRKMEWLNGKPGGLEELGVNAFYLRGFGSVFFGELLISEVSRRLTMIRFQLGSDAGGEVSVAESETNGSYFP